MVGTARFELQLQALHPVGLGPPSPQRSVTAVRYVSINASEAGASRRVELLRVEDVDETDFSSLAGGAIEVVPPEGKTSNQGVIERRLMFVAQS